MTLGKERKQVHKSDFKKFPGLRSAVKSQKNHEFFVVDIAPSFHGSDGVIFRKADITISLETPGRHLPDELRPKVWAMDPIKDANQIHRTNSDGLTVPIKPAGISLSKGSDYQDEAAHIRAYGLKQPRASWKLTKTLGRDISGTYPLCMVIKVPRHCVTEVIIEAKGTVERRRLVVLRERADSGTAQKLITFEPGTVRQADPRLGSDAE